MRTTYNTLTNQIQYWVDNQSEKTVETIQLFININTLE